MVHHHKTVTQVEEVQVLVPKEVIVEVNHQVVKHIIVVVQKVVSDVLDMDVVMMNFTFF